MNRCTSLVKSRLSLKPFLQLNSSLFNWRSKLGKDGLNIVSTLIAEGLPGLPDGKAATPADIRKWVDDQLGSGLNFIFADADGKARIIYFLLLHWLTFIGRAARSGQNWSSRLSLATSSSSASLMWRSRIR